MYLEKAINGFLTGYFSTNDRGMKTVSAYFTDMRQFESYIGKRINLTSIRSIDIEHWAAHLKTSGYAPASIRRKIIVLKLFFTYWVRNGSLVESPFWRIKINLGKIVQLPRTLTESDMRALLTQTKKAYSSVKDRRHINMRPETKGNRLRSQSFLILRNVALLELLFATGLRVSEISAINIQDFITSEAAFKVQGKGRKERMAFVVDSITLLIQNEHLAVRQMIHAETSALFLNVSGTRLSTQGIANVVKKFRQDCGIEQHVTPHMLRHTVATLLLRNGTDIRVVQEFLGHASIATTQRYTHIAKEHLIHELQNRHPSIRIRND